MKITIRENKSSRKLILAKINPNKVFSEKMECRILILVRDNVYDIQTRSCYVGVR